LFAMMEIPKWVQKVPLTNTQMLVAGGALLLFAAILMITRRRTRVVVVNSPLTEEVMVYLARIANAVESYRGPSSDEIAAEFMRRLQEKANDPENTKENSREMPLSMFGREILRKQ
jgi:hypothetical protein